MTLKPILKYCLYIQYFIIHMQYSELHCITNFTFLRGASHPHELVTMASNLGYRALAITDECSLAGVVKAHVATFNRNIKLIIGSEFKIDSHKVIVLVTNRNSYSKLSSLITLFIIVENFPSS